MNEIKDEIKKIDNYYTTNIDITCFISTLARKIVEVIEQHEERIVALEGNQNKLLEKKETPISLLFGGISNASTDLDIKVDLNQKTFDKIKDRLNSLEESIKSIEGMVENQKNNEQTLEEKIDSLEKNNKNIGEKIELQKRDNQTFEETLNSFKERIKSIENKADNQRNDIQTHEERLNSLDKNVKNFEEQVEIRRNFEYLLENRIGTIETNIKSIEVSFENQRNNANNHEERIKKLEESTEINKENIEEQKNNAQILEEKLSLHEKSVKNIEDNYKDIVKRLLEVEKNIESIEEQNKIERDNFYTLNKRIGNVKDKIEILGNNQDIYEKRIDMVEENMLSPENIELCKHVYKNGIIESIINLENKMNKTDGINSILINYGENRSYINLKKSISNGKLVSINSKLGEVFLRTIIKNDFESFSLLLPYININENYILSSLEGLNGKSPLYIALLFDNRKIARKLIEEGADVNEKDNEGKSLLQRAYELDNNEAVNLLILNGAYYECRKTYIDRYGNKRMHTVRTNKPPPSSKAQRENNNVPHSSNDKTCCRI